MVVNTAYCHGLLELVELLNLEEVHLEETGRCYLVVKVVPLSRRPRRCWNLNYHCCCYLRLMVLLEVLLVLEAVVVELMDLLLMVVVLVVCRSSEALEETDPQSNRQRLSGTESME